MGDSASQTNARSLREILEGLDCVSQHVAAIQWAKNNDRVIDLFGDFAKNRHLLLFQSGNESENWLDSTLNLVYKMNMLSHVGDNILKLLDRIDIYNGLFPETAMHLIGFQVMSEYHAFPVFSQEFIDNVRFATREEINEYMQARGFHPVTDDDGCYANDSLLLSDVKPKNVLRSDDGIMYVVDAEICKTSM